MWSATEMASVWTQKLCTRYPLMKNVLYAHSSFLPAVPFFLRRTWWDSYVKMFGLSRERTRSRTNGEGLVKVACGPPGLPGRVAIKLLWVGTTVFRGPQNFEPSRRICLFPRNIAEFGNFRVHSVDLRCYLVDMRIITIDESSNCTKIVRLLRSLSTVLIYGTICSLCKVYLVQLMDLNAQTFVYIINCLRTRNKSRRNS